MVTRPNPSTTPEPDPRFASYADRVDAFLDGLLPGADVEPSRLHEAMRYVVTGGGKRVRPLLTYGAAEALAIDADRVDAIAAALELIHAYSLVHDDLPAMDDDELRRGRPTCHIAFDEATAILAGDALQALAFEAVVQGAGAAAGPLVAAFADACGSQGMAGGQVIDLQAVGHAMTLADLKRMHALKTGALIRAAVVLPAVLVDAPSIQRKALTGFGECIGLAFQIQDDILDVEGSTEELGKPQGSDEAREKPTYPSLVGLDASHRMANEALADALDHLRALPGDHSLLSALARYIVLRRH
ncbi:MAG: polyprenyl synthetase family protein [Pseudomonadota bacterium]